MSNKVKLPRNTVATQPVQEEPPVVQVKRIILSKTIWVNFVSLICFFLQQKYGFIIDPDLQLQFLSLINIALRFVTKEPIAWGGGNGNSKETS